MDKAASAAAFFMAAGSVAQWMLVRYPAAGGLRQLRLYLQLGTLSLPLVLLDAFGVMIMGIGVMVLLVLVSSAAVADQSLWQRLMTEPNMVVLMRNAESSGNRDGADMLTWDASGGCRGESLLTAEGRAQARTVGEAFAVRGIRPRVISSPMCRCTETAEIAFGEYLADPELRQRAPGDVAAEAAFQAKATALLRRHRGGSPVVLVNHRPNIDALSMELIDVGELLIGTISETGEVEVVGKLRP